MSTQTSTRTTTPAPTAASPRVGATLGEPRAVPFTRVAHVELRKMVDTLAGRWLLIATVAFAVAVMALFIAFGETDEISVGLFLGLVGLPFGVLVPVLGIMAATAEWSQRAGLVTFTLEPRRGRVIAARVAAGLVLGTGVVLASTVLAYLATALGGLTGAQTSYALDPWVLLGFLTMMLLSLLQGLAFGLLLLNTPAAIVSILSLPLVFTLATSLTESAERIAQWLDLTLASAPLSEGSALTGTELAHLVTSSLVWIALPFAIGAWRILRREVK